MLLRRRVDGVVVARGEVTQPHAKVAGDLGDNLETGLENVEESNLAYKSNIKVLYRYIFDSTYSTPKRYCSIVVLLNAKVWKTRNERQ